MFKNCWRVAGLTAILAVVLAPSAPAAGLNLPGPTAGTQAKERAYGKHCSAMRATARSRSRAKCLNAMAKLATGRAHSPRKVCRGLSHKKARGTRASAYASCVRAGTKILKDKKRSADKQGSSADDDDKASGDDADEDGDFLGDDPEGDDDGNPFGSPSDEADDVDNDDGDPFVLDDPDEPDDPADTLFANSAEEE